MAKAKSKSGGSWTAKDLKEMQRLVRKASPTRKIAKALGRTEAAIRSRAQKEGISLRVAVTEKKKKR